MRNCSFYQRLVTERQGLLSQINPNNHPENANCPETADAVNDFLNTGRIRQVRTASSTASFVFPPGVTFIRTSNIHQTATNLPNCSHVVVKGIRGRGRAQTTALEHYFVIFKCNHVVYVADAYTLELVHGVQAYINAEVENNRMRDFFIASQNYDVTINDPLAGI